MDPGAVLLPDVDQAGQDDETQVLPRRIGILLPGVEEEAVGIRAGRLVGGIPVVDVTDARNGAAMNGESGGAQAPVGQGARVHPPPWQGEYMQVAPPHVEEILPALPEVRAAARREIQQEGEQDLHGFARSLAR